jgi:hypothetical protein
MKRLDEFFAYDEIQKEVRYPENKHSDESVVVVSFIFSKISNNSI